jgi:hypothetical protein
MPEKQHVNMGEKIQTGNNKIKLLAEYESFIIHRINTVEC